MKKSHLRGHLAWLAVLVSAVTLDAVACMSRAPHPITPVAPAASRAFAEARAAARSRPDGWREKALGGVRMAEQHAPGWVAPRRLRDDLMREDLLSAEALSEHLEALDAAPGDPLLLYLVGRLEGAAGALRFEEAQRRDPEFAWAYHGRAWLHFLSGDTRAAQRLGSKALRYAREPWEASYFAIALARYAEDRGDRELGLELLRPYLDDERLEPADRIEVALWMTRFELTDEDEVRAERGFWRGLDLLRTSELPEAQVFELAERLSEYAERGSGRSAQDALDAALAAQEGAGREAARARLLFTLGEDVLALSLLSEVEGASSPSNHLRLRAAAFGWAEPSGLLMDWLQALPDQVKDATGLPLRPELRALVEASGRATDSAGRLAFAEALLAAGWFDELRSYSAQLARFDLEAALGFEARAAAGLALLSGIEHLLERVDEGGLFGGPWGTGASEAAGSSEPQKDAEAARRLAKLDALFGAMQPLFERYHGRPERSANLFESPRLEYGPFASVVHPGPRFSAEDELAGRGPEGAPVGGLARELARIGRFGVFGESAGGGGPDGTVLRLLATEFRAGEHLGVAFHGTVAWCEGADVGSRPVRRGARITGAALHEGYWVDVAGVRADLERWNALEREFFGEGSERAVRALETVGPELLPNARDWERRRLYAAQEEARRMRLAILAGREARPGGRMTLEELLEATAIHEEGHLTDRTRFLPISRKPLAGLGLLLEAGVSPGGVAKRLEYRAQLVALAALDDPRVALADCLDGVEGGARITPHAAAYRELLDDFLEVLDNRLADYPRIESGRYLVHQLHRLTPDEVRTLARELARRQGLLAD